MIRLHLLGQIRLSSPAHEFFPRVLAGDHRLALLAYLALGAPGLRRRDAILGLLWPEETTANSRHSLRQLLHVLRGLLGPDVIVMAGKEYVGLNRDRVWCDAAAFQDALAQGAYEQALHLYGGALCDGFFLPSAPPFERWLEDERERLHECAAETGLQLAREHHAAGDLVSSLKWGRWSLRLTPGNEDLLRKLMRGFEHVSGAGAALQLYEEFRGILRDQFDLEPSAETEALAAALRARQGSIVTASDAF